MLARKLRRELGRMAGQVVTIALVIASAVGGFLGCISTYRSLEAARDDYYASSRFADAFVDVTRAPRALVPTLASIPGVAAVDVGVRREAQLTLDLEPRPLVATLVGLPRTAPVLDVPRLRAGRWPQPGAGAEAVLEEGFAQARGLRPGARMTVLLNGRREILQIVGIGLGPEFVIAAATGGIPDPRGYAVVWMDEERLASMLDLRGAFTHAAFRLTPDAHAAAVLTRVDAALARYGGLGAYLRDDQPSHRALAQEIEQQRVLGTVLPGVFLWVVGFLLNVVMSRHVATQREQIAALKALGLADGAILVHYLAFVVAFVSVGVICGVLVGEAFGEWMTQLYREYFHFPSAPHRLGMPEVGIAAAAAYGTALAGAWRAVRDATGIPPAQALRPASPARYRPLLVDRFGPARRLGSAARMVLRQLERRPGRAALVVSGIAGAGALVVAGAFWWDAIGYLIESQFGRVDRTDAIVALDRPVHESVAYAAARWPGVLQVQVQRSVPVRIEAGSRSRRTAILGLPDGPDLRRLLDERWRSTPLPPDGLVLGAELAARLGVAAGDAVRIVPLEEPRRARTVRIEAVVRELFAMTAYMRLDALQRLVGGGETVDALGLRYATGSANALYAAWRDTPRVRSVVVKSEVLAGFRATSARNVLAFTSVIAAFAAAIAFGVVYNSARVALAERAWELATLRVFGFTRAEVSALLLGELASELLVAIPIGCLFGRALAQLLVTLVHDENFRIPVVIAPTTYLAAVATIVVAGVASAWLVRRRVDGLDLVAVLKVRE
jgi:putative ABC transport system permease protein